METFQTIFYPRPVIKYLLVVGLAAYSLVGLVVLYENGFFYRHYYVVKSYGHEYNNSKAVESKVVQVPCFFDCLIKTTKDTPTTAVIN